MGEQTENTRVDDTAEDQVEEEETAAVEPVVRDVDDEPEARPRSAARWLGLAALLIALAALALALINVIRPDWTEKFDKTPMTTAAPPPGPSEQQITEARTKACDAFNLVGGAVTARTSIDLGPTPVPVEAGLVEANVRQTFATGHEYLLSRIEPATPNQLADLLRRFASDMQDVGMNSLAGSNREDPEQAARLQNMVDLNGQIVELCK